jgi:hypothetical protein
MRAKSTAVSLDDVALFARVDSNSLVQAVEAVAKIREHDLESARGLYQAITGAERALANLDLNTSRLRDRFEPDALSLDG